MAARMWSAKDNQWSGNCCETGGLGIARRFFRMQALPGRGFHIRHLILENSEGSHIGFEDISDFHRMPSMTNSAHSLFSKASL